MPADRPFPVPSSTQSLLAWAMENPEAVRAALQFLNKLHALEVQLVTPGSTTSGRQKLVDSEQNTLLPLPIQLPEPIEDVDESDLIDVARGVNELLAALRTTKQLPSS